MSKKIWLIGLALLASFSIATNWQKVPLTIANNSGIDVKNVERSIIVGYSNWAGWWPWAIAESEGLFNKHGINVELRWYDNYSQSLKDLAAGYIDANSQALSDTITFAPEAIKGEVVVLVNDNSAGNDKIIAAPGIDRVRDLKNKVVALEEGVVEDFLLTLALEKAAMSRTDVKVVDVETGAAVEAFLALQADAVGAFPPFWLAALDRPGAKEIVSSKQFPGAIVDLLVVTQELNDLHSEQVQALVDTWFDVLDFIAKAPTAADKIMAKKAGVTYEQMQLFKQGTKIFDRQENIEAFSPGNNMKHLSFSAQKISNFLEKNFTLINQNLDYSKFFNAEYIRGKVKVESREP